MSLNAVCFSHSRVAASLRIAGLISAVALSAALPAHAVVYDFKMTGGAQGGLPNSSNSLFVEVTPAAGNPSGVLFTFTNEMAEPMSSIAFTYFDTGSDLNLFSSVSVQSFTGQVNYVQRIATSHPFLPTNYTPEYRFGLSTVFPYDREIWGVNPGDSVTLLATLGSGRSFSDVSAALDLGISANAATAASGLRVGIFTYHLLGSALYDDGAHITNSVVSSPIPEPQTWLMMLSAIGVIGFFARRHNGSA